MKKVYQKIASLLEAIKNNVKKGNEEWCDNFEIEIENLVRDYLPSGSGFDSGTKILFDESNEKKIVFATEFHHMNENGFYDGWTEYKIIVTPSLSLGFDLKVTGRDRNQIKDYIYETFSYALEQIVKESIECEAEKAELALYMTPFNGLGSFKLAFYDLLFKADGNNLDILSQAFPRHVEAIRIYRKHGPDSEEFNSFKKKNS